MSHSIVHNILHLGYGIIPVVRGSVNYETIAPNTSYINVNDFKNPKDLAKYLLLLDKNDDKYLDYFQWFDKVKYYEQNWRCELCKMLHDENLPHKVYKNVTQWLLTDMNNKPACNP